MDEARMMQRLDAMVANGRITTEEAAQLRAAEGTPAFEAVVARVRARHAQAHTDPAVADGTMSREEADELLARVRAGEHSNELRKQVRGTAERPHATPSDPPDVVRGNRSAGQQNVEAGR